MRTRARGHSRVGDPHEDCWFPSLHSILFSRACPVSQLLQLPDALSSACPTPQSCWALLRPEPASWLGMFPQRKSWLTVGLALRVPFSQDCSLPLSVCLMGNHLSHLLGAVLFTPPPIYRGMLVQYRFCIIP